MAAEGAGPQGCSRMTPRTSAALPHPTEGRLYRPPEPWRILRQAGLRTRERKSRRLRTPTRRLPRTFAPVVPDAARRPGGRLLRGGKAPRPRRIHTRPPLRWQSRLGGLAAHPIPVSPASKAGRAPVALLPFRFSVQESEDSRRLPIAGVRRTAKATRCSGEGRRRHSQRHGKSGTHHHERYEKLRTAGSPHPGEHQTAILGPVF